MSVSKQTFNDNGCNEDRLKFEEVVIDDLEQCVDDVDDDVDHLIEPNIKSKSKNSHDQFSSNEENDNCVQQSTHSHKIYTLKSKNQHLRSRKGSPANLRLFKRTSRIMSRHHQSKRKGVPIKLQRDISRQRVVEECELFGKFLTKKLCKLPDSKRDLLMLKINQLLYETTHHFISNVY